MERINTREARGGDVGVKGIAVEAVVASVAMAVGKGIAVEVGTGENNTSTATVGGGLQAGSMNRAINTTAINFDLNIAPYFPANLA
jgi:hypothetical protein